MDTINVPKSLKSKDIHFLLYDNSSKNTCSEIILDDTESIKQSGFDDKKKTKVLIHGFLAHAFSEFPRNARDAYLKKQNNCNVICVNWGPLSGKKVEDYGSVVLGLSSVATNVAEFLAWLKKNTELDLSEVHLVGHSLGAHICGMVGKSLKARGTALGRISALDPAGVGYGEFLAHNMLAETDANFVDAYHTTEFLGTTKLVGHVDFFIALPKQPNLILAAKAGIQNHSEAHRIFSKTILDGPEKNDVTLQVLEHGGTCTVHPILMGEYCKPGTAGRFDIEYPFNNGPDVFHTDEYQPNQINAVEGEPSQNNKNEEKRSKENQKEGKSTVEGEPSKENTDEGKRSKENTKEFKRRRDNMDKGETSKTTSDEGEPSKKIFKPNPHVDRPE